MRRIFIWWQQSRQTDRQTDRQTNDPEVAKAVELFSLKLNGALALVGFDKETIHPSSNNPSVIFGIDSEGTINFIKIKVDLAAHQADGSEGQLKMENGHAFLVFSKGSDGYLKVDKDAREPDLEGQHFGAVMREGGIGREELKKTGESPQIPDGAEIKNKQWFKASGDSEILLSL